MNKGLSSEFLQSIEPTQESTEELKLKLVIAELRDIIVKTIDDGELSIGGKKLTTEDAINMLEDGVNTESEELLLESIMVFDAFKTTSLSEFIEHEEEPYELSVATHKVALQSALEVFKERRPEVKNDVDVYLTPR